MRFADANVTVSVGGGGLITPSPARPSQPELPSLGELPFTGAVTDLLIVAALLFIVTGICLIVLSQRRSLNHA